LLVNEAAALGRALCDQVIELSPTRRNWLGITYIRNNERLQVSLLSPNLYDGVSGIAVFLATLTGVTGSAAFGELALSALEPLRRSIRGVESMSARRLVEQLGLGATLGVGSVIYALCKVSVSLKDLSLLDDAVQVARSITPRHINGDVRYDIMAGAGGAILGLLTLHGMTHERIALNRAIACGRHLLDAQISRGQHAGRWPGEEAHAMRHGFAHGASGIAVALLRLFATTGQDSFRRAAERALAFERRALAPTTAHRSAHAHGRTIDEPVLAGWCHGAPGLGLGYLDALHVLDSNALRDDATRAVALTRREGTRGVDHLCCGSMGRTETLVVAARALGRAPLEAIARRQASEIVARARAAGGYRLGNAPASRGGFVNPALFQGLSGIGYQLLRLARSDIVPSLLLFR
jgi:type 2 lantibiotic biosynthesis protein LanM